MSVIWETVMGVCMCKAADDTYRGGKSEFPIINPYMVSKYLQDRVQCPAGALQAWTRLDTSLGLFLDHGLIVCTSLGPTNSIFRPWPYCVHYCVHYRVHYCVHMQVHLQVHMQALFLPGCRCTCRIYGKLYSATTVCLKWYVFYGNMSKMICLLW